MAGRIPDAATVFTLHYKNGPIKVSTGDQIRFQVEFSGGDRKEMVFEIDTAMDLHWSFIPEGNQNTAKEIGKLIEQQMMF